MLPLMHSKDLKEVMLILNVVILFGQPQLVIAPLPLLDPWLIILQLLYQVLFHNLRNKSLKVTL